MTFSLWITNFLQPIYRYIDIHTVYTDFNVFIHVSFSLLSQISIHIDIPISLPLHIYIYMYLHRRTYIWLGMCNVTHQQMAMCYWFWNPVFNPLFLFHFLNLSKTRRTIWIPPDSLPRSFDINQDKRTNRCYGLVEHSFSYFSFQFTAAIFELVLLLLSPPDI